MLTSSGCHCLSHITTLDEQNVGYKFLVRLASDNMYASLFWRCVRILDSRSLQAANHQARKSMIGINSAKSCSLARGKIRGISLLESLGR